MLLPKRYMRYKRRVAMAYNTEKHRHECDRCGKPIPQDTTLCKECAEYLENYMRAVRSKRNKESSDADNN